VARDEDAARELCYHYVAASLRAFGKNAASVKKSAEVRQAEAKLEMVRAK
jgi:hypothetical protein